MVALMRVVLSVSGLTVVTMVPAGPEHFASGVSIALIAFTLYSIGVWLLELKGHAAFRAVSDWGHWIDVGWFTLLIALSRGTVSIFFWYFFPILVASFRWGFVPGIRVVAVSTILFTTVGLSLSPPIPELERQRFLIRPIYFITVGYLMAYWGGAEVRLRRRMALLQEIGTVSNPRFGVDRTLGVIMNRLILFYGRTAARSSRPIRSPARRACGARVERARRSRSGRARSLPKWPSSFCGRRESRASSTAWPEKRSGRGCAESAAPSISWIRQRLRPS
jgi:hypothetical protein